MGTVRIPRWRVKTTNKRGDTGTYCTANTKVKAQAEARQLRAENKRMIAAKDRFWIGYKSIRIERTEYSKKRKKR